MEQNFFEWLQSTPIAVAVGESWFPWVESTHVVFLALVFGTILTVDARLVGLASRHLRVSYLAERLLPWTWLGFAGAAITGLLMFSCNAVTYSGNKPFLFKMGLLVAAGLNMLYFQFVTYRRVQDWDMGRPVPAARAAGFISMLLWTGVVGFGRWIGFV
jgi:formate-dependent nitrite reductase membrane component NrfD